MKKIITADNIANNFKLNPENVIQIAPYFGEYSKNDTVLFELKNYWLCFINWDMKIYQLPLKIMLKI